MERPIKHYLAVIEQSVRNNWNEPALSDFQEPIAYTYGEMAVQVERLRKWLVLMNVNKGDKVAICARSCSHWAIAYLAVVANGSTVVSILPDFTAENIEFLVRHSDSKLLFAGAQVSAKFKKPIEGVTTVNMEDWKVTSGNATPRLPDGEALIPEQINWHGHTLDEIAIINYTSGTTDKPKGVMLSSRAVSSNVGFALRTIPNRPGEALLSMLPMAHIFGIMFDFLYQVAGGVHVVFLKKSPTPSLILSGLSEVKPYMMLCVPLLIEKIVKSKVLPVMRKPVVRLIAHIPLLRRLLFKRIKAKILDSFGGNLRMFIIGGAALDPEVEDVLARIEFPYSCGYGMTECAPLISYSPVGTFAKRSVGRAVDGISIKIDSDNPHEKPGELLVRGDNLFNGYYNNDEANAKAFTEDGWFHTGDMGIVDEAGNIRLRGRCKNMILGPSGQNIYPEEIEAKLNNMPHVTESLVLSREGKLVALVYASYEMGERSAVERQMSDNLVVLNKMLPHYSQVQKIELVEEEFKKTPKMSIKRFLYR